MTTYEERYFYPGTQTLINNFDIKDPRLLREAETELTADLFRTPFHFDYRTTDGLKQAHKEVFGVLYPWAGEFRAENITKVEQGPREDVHFLDGPRVASAMTTFCSSLSQDLSSGAFSGLDQKTFAYRASVYLADLNHLHPFPDGNGRIQRLFLSELAQDSGYQIDQTKFTRDAWIDGSISSRENALYNIKDQLVGLTDDAAMPALISKSMSRLERTQVQERTSPTARLESSVEEARERYSDMLAKQMRPGRDRGRDQDD
ncbi:MAG: Fic family protein [Henriciella sp.]